LRLWRETKLGLNCCKSENNLKEILDQAVGWSGSQGALLPPGPLGTVHATFAAHSSSLYKRPFHRTRFGYDPTLTVDLAVAIQV